MRCVPNSCTTYPCSCVMYTIRTVLPGLSRGEFILQSAITTVIAVPLVTIYFVIDRKFKHFNSVAMLNDNAIIPIDVCCCSYVLLHIDVIQQHTLKQLESHEGA